VGDFMMNWFIFWGMMIAGVIGIIYLFWQIDCYVYKKPERPEPTPRKKK
jgi:hypothetical protein